MKKVILALACAIMAIGAQAQVSYGVKAGFDLTNFWGENVKHGMKPSYQAGLFLEYKFNDKFAIAPEAVFASQGGKFKAVDGELATWLDKLGEGSLNKDITYNVNYINIPVMLKYYVTPDFSIDFGPQLGINVYSKYSIKDVDDAVDIKDGTESVDFGLGLGGTYNLTSNAFLQARYTMGLTKTFKDLDDCKNGNIQISLGYRF